MSDLAALKTRMRDAHPDRGGSNAAFIAARAAFVAARDGTPRRDGVTPRQRELLDNAYQLSRDAMLMTLREGFTEGPSLRAVQRGMLAMAPHQQAFGAARYAELRELLDRVERLPVREPGLMLRLRRQLAATPAWQLFAALAVIAAVCHFAGIPVH